MFGSSVRMTFFSRQEIIIKKYQSGGRDVSETVEDVVPSTSFTERPTSNCAQYDASVKIPEPRSGAEAFPGIAEMRKQCIRRAGLHFASPALIARLALLCKGSPRASTFS